MSYSPLFDPAAGAAADLESRSFRLGDRTPRLVYVYDDDPATGARGTIRLAIDAALATGRPILLSGDPGTGKSSLAAAVADRLGWRSYRLTVSSRTQAQDFLWTFDAVRRLGDAQAGESHLKPDAAYLEPGVLWWAFHPTLAERRGMDEAAWATNTRLEDSALAKVPPATDPGLRSHPRAVVLIDEIDKADPDVPNNLLEPLGSLQFSRPNGPPVLAQIPPLVFITTNRERELPQAFLRRCLALELQAPGPERLRQIAQAHYPSLDPALLDRITQTYQGIRADHEQQRLPKPGTAEYLDAIGACLQLRVATTDPDWDLRWQEIADLALRKTPSRLAS